MAAITTALQFWPGMKYGSVHWGITPIPLPAGSTFTEHMLSICRVLGNSIVNMEINKCSTQTNIFVRPPGRPGSRGWALPPLGIYNPLNWFLCPILLCIRQRCHRMAVIEMFLIIRTEWILLIIFLFLEGRSLGVCALMLFSLVYATTTHLFIPVRHFLYFAKTFLFPVVKHSDRSDANDDICYRIISGQIGGDNLD